MNLRSDTLFSGNSLLHSTLRVEKDEQAVWHDGESRDRLVHRVSEEPRRGSFRKDHEVGGGKGSKLEEGSRTGGKGGGGGGGRGLKVNGGKIVSGWRSLNWVEKLKLG